jgi:hypothetical protein
MFKTTARAEARAKAICAKCPIREACLEYAVETRQPEGVWGGCSTTERVLLAELGTLVLPAEQKIPAGYRQCWCGIVFRKSGNKRFCTNVCNMRYKYALARSERFALRVITPRMCEQCGVEVPIKAHSDARFCSGICRRRASWLREQNDPAKMERRRRYKLEYNERKKVKNRAS